MPRLACNDYTATGATTTPRAQRAVTRNAELQRRSGAGQAMRLIDAGGKNEPVQLAQNGLSMTDALPRFRYHPDPLTTGSVEESDTSCACCKRVRGYVYVGPVYSETDLDDVICPWCIADGSAASNLGASFADCSHLSKVGIARKIVEEINLRTPGYISWQQEHWLSHCNDACEFHGDATSADVRAASEDTRRAWMDEYNQDEKGWLWVTEGYEPGGDSALYKFACRHCHTGLLGWDLS